MFSLAKFLFDPSFVSLSVSISLFLSLPLWHTVHVHVRVYVHAHAYTHTQWVLPDQLNKSCRHYDTSQLFWHDLCKSKNNHHHLLAHHTIMMPKKMNNNSIALLCVQSTFKFSWLSQNAFIHHANWDNINMWTKIFISSKFWKQSSFFPLWDVF